MNKGNEKMSCEKIGTKFVRLNGTIEMIGLQFTWGSRLVKCTIQPSFKTFEPRLFVCFTLWTILISGILLLGVELQLNLNSLFKLCLRNLDLFANFNFAFQQRLKLNFFSYYCFLSFFIFFVWNIPRRSRLVQFFHRIIATWYAVLNKTKLLTFIRSRIKQLKKFFVECEQLHIFDIDHSQCRGNLHSIYFRWIGKTSARVERMILDRCRYRSLHYVRRIDLRARCLLRCLDTRLLSNFTKFTS